MRVLVIEDDRKTSAVLAQGLSEAAFEVEVEHDGKKGLAAAESGVHDLIVLDLMLPGMDGMQVLSALRRNRSTPVLLLSGRGALEDRVRGLQAGADDYLIKPFAFPELLARLHCILRRGKPPQPLLLTVADLELDTLERCARRGGRRIDFTGKEYALLNLFMRRSGETLSRATIALLVWSIDFDTGTNVVDVAVRRLRAKVDDPFERPLIHAVRGAGYVMEPRDGLGQGRPAP
jgi:two-component system copper resistance phosphate regulon response regulator CusR